MLTTLDKRADRAYQLCCASRFLLVSCVLHTVNIALHHYLAQLQHTQRKTASTATKICYASKSLGITVVALSRSYVPYISPHATARAEKREYEDIWTGAVFYIFIKQMVVVYIYQPSTLCEQRRTHLLLGLLFAGRRCIICEDIGEGERVFLFFSRHFVGQV